MPVRNGNIDNDRTTTTKAASMRKQLGTKNSKSNEGRRDKNGGDKADYIHWSNQDTRLIETGQPSGRTTTPV